MWQKRLHGSDIRIGLQRMGRNLTDIHRKRRLENTEQKKKIEYKKGMRIRKSIKYIQENPIS